MSLVSIKPLTVFVLRGQLLDMSYVWIFLMNSYPQSLWCFMCPFCNTRHVPQERDDRRHSSEDSEDVSYRLSSVRGVVTTREPEESRGTTCRPRSMVSDLPRPDSAALQHAALQHPGEQWAVSPACCRRLACHLCTGTRHQAGPHTGTAALQHCSTSSAVAADNLNISQFSQQQCGDEGDKL